MLKAVSRSLCASRPRHVPCRRVLPESRTQVRSFSQAQQRQQERGPFPSSSGSQQQQNAPRFPRPPPASSAELEQHLNTLFRPLKFPPELAARILTHASHPDAYHRHNARLSFIGRRVMQSYLLMFIHNSKALLPSHDYDLIVQRALNTYVLGQHVGVAWGLGKVLRWTPVHSGPIAGMANKENLREVITNLGPEAALNVGLYKVQGTAVEAVVGGVFHQFGGSVAHRLFHTRVLPYILLSGNEGLPEAFHSYARKVSEQMGGSTGQLLAPQKPSP